MNSLENFELSFAFASYWFVILAVAAALLVFFYYRFTIPAISKTKRIALAFVRFLVLFLLLLMIFEPVLKLEYRTDREPKLFLFVDNSSSILNSDSANVGAKILQAAITLGNAVDQKIRLFTFGDRTGELKLDSLSGIGFDRRFTNFSQIVPELENSGENIGGAVIISDGNYNQGSDPLDQFVKSGIPVFTVGVGDTVSEMDVVVDRVFTNSYIYAGTETVLEAVVFNSGFGSVPTQLTLREGSEVIETKNITLNSSGINRVKFSFTPKTPGKKVLRISATPIEGEHNEANNVRVFNITVLNSKLRILVVSGSLHPDAGAVKNALIKNENFAVSSITEIAKKKTLETYSQTEIDSSDVVILQGYPSEDSDPALLEKIKFEILDAEKPALFQVTAETDLSKLMEFSRVLPFEIESPEIKEDLVQVEITDPYNPIWGNSGINVLKWNSLPPVYQALDLITPAGGAKVLADAEIRNVNTGVPIIISRKIGKRRTLAILASSIYKWRLRPDEESMLFDEFIQNSVKWLSISNSIKRVRLSADKEIYAAGEPITIRAEVYDENFNPQNNADVRVNFGDGNSVLMNSAGPGNYEGIARIPESGKFSFKGEAFEGAELIGRDALIIETAPVDYEKLETGLNDNFLKLISNETGGYYLYIDDVNNSVDKFVKNMDNRVRIDRSTEEINIWSFEIMLAFLILLLAVEWFERKRSGLL